MGGDVDVWMRQRMSTPMSFPCGCVCSCVCGRESVVGNVKRSEELRLMWEMDVDVVTALLQLGISTAAGMPVSSFTLCTHWNSDPLKLANA